jgi:hypothetical protein
MKECENALLSHALAGASNLCVELRRGRRNIAK